MKENTVILKEFPKCDFCGDNALYDAKTKFGQWAYMCEKHYRDYGIGLGVGKGQKLMVSNDKCEK